MALRSENWGQAVEEFHGRHGLTIIANGELFGHSRQAFYKKKTGGVEKLTTERKILDIVREIREIDLGIVGVKLWLMLSTMFGSGRIPYRDAFLNLLRSHQLMQKKRRSRSTTNSNRRYHKC